MTPLLSLFLRNALIGFGLAVLAVAGILAGDVAGLRGLMLGSPEGWLAMAALTFLMGLTFGSVQIGIAIMALGEDEPRDGGRRPEGRTPELATVPVRASAHPRHR